MGTRAPPSPTASWVRRVFGIFAAGLLADLAAGAAVRPCVQRLFTGVAATAVRAVLFAAESEADFAARPGVFVLRIAVFAMAEIVPVSDIDRTIRARPKRRCVTMTYRISFDWCSSNAPQPRRRKFHLVCVPQERHA